MLFRKKTGCNFMKKRGLARQGEKKEKESRFLLDRIIK